MFSFYGDVRTSFRTHGVCYTGDFDRENKKWTATVSLDNLDINIEVIREDDDTLTEKKITLRSHGVNLCEYVTTWEHVCVIVNDDYEFTLRKFVEDNSLKYSVIVRKLKEKYDTVWYVETVWYATENDVNVIYY